MSFVNPTFPSTLSAAGTFGPVKLEPMDRSCLITLSGSYTAAVAIIEVSADNGVNDPYGPVAAVRFNTLEKDTFDGSGMTLDAGVTYRWGVGAIIEGGYIRVRIVSLTGSIRCNMIRSGRFFLDAPPTVEVEVGGAGSQASVAARLQLLELMRIRIGIQEVSNRDLITELVLSDADDAIAAAD